MDGDFDYADGMLSVQKAIRALRRQILAALSDETTLPGSVSLVADRVSVSLAVRISATESAEEPGWLVVATEPAPCLHHVTLEFHLTAAADLENRPPQVIRQPGSTDAPVIGAALSNFAVLTEVFGAPGFDSSARATVFREALEQLSEEQRCRVLVSLGTMPSPGEEPTVTQARHLIQRLAASGPAGSERGSEKLRQLASTGTVGELIRLAERWKTQSEWASVVREPKDF
ncbi:MAG: hypothetical protein EXS36_18890 [Pedosphaera sp.]|nr:hypothetical protein [Pedosphaera sp.]